MRLERLDIYYLLGKIIPKKFGGFKNFPYICIIS